MIFVPREDSDLARLIWVFSWCTNNFVDLWHTPAQMIFVICWPWLPLWWSLFEPCHEIMVLLVLRKLILQKRMGSHPVGLDVWFLVRPYAYFHTSCVQTAKALARLCGCVGSPEPSLVVYMISTIISWAGSFDRVLDDAVRELSDKPL